MQNEAFVSKLEGDGLALRSRFGEAWASVAGCGRDEAGLCIRAAAC